MSNHATAHDYEIAPVKFSRLTRRGVLLGLSGSQLVVVGFGAIVLVFALYFGGGQSLMYVVPILLLCAALAFVGVGGRKIVAWLPVGAKCVWRSTGEQLLFRRHIVSPVLPERRLCLVTWHGFGSGSTPSSVRSWSTTRTPQR